MAKLSVKDLKVGMTVILIDNAYRSYGLSKGDTVEISHLNGASIIVQSPNGSVNVRISSISIYPITRENLLEEIKEAEEKVQAAKDKIKWMEETKSEEYDENEYKVWEILGALDGRSSRVVKAKKIAALIKK